MNNIEFDKATVLKRVHDSGHNTGGTGSHSRTMTYILVSIAVIVAAIIFIVFSSGNNNPTITPIDKLSHAPETQIATAVPDNSRNDTKPTFSSSTEKLNLDAAMKVPWKKSALGYLDPIIKSVPEWKGKVAPLYDNIIRAKKEDELSTNAFTWHINYNYLTHIRTLRNEVQQYLILVEECNQVEKDILENATDKSTGITVKWNKEIQQITDSYNKSKANSGTDAIKDAIKK